MNARADREQPSEPSLDFREPGGVGSGLTVELFVEGERVANASVRDDALTDMQTLLGASRAEVRKQLETTLTERFERDLARVTVTTPVRIPSAMSPSAGERFLSQYVYELTFEKIEVGVTWYDVASDVVGPASAPPLARHRMRLAVRRLTRKPLRVVLDILEALSA